MREERGVTAFEKMQRTFTIVAVISAIVSVILFVIISVWDEVAVGAVPVEFMCCAVVALCLPYAWAIVYGAYKIITVMCTKKD